MHRLIREDEKYRNRLETFDRKFAILKFYLQRKFELNYDLFAFEMDLTNKHPTKRKELIKDFVPAWNSDLSFDEIKAFLKTVWVDDADNTYLYNGRLFSDNDNEFNEYLHNEMEDFYYFKDMVNGKLELHELIEGRSKSIYQHKRSANEYVYTKMP